MTVFEGGVCLSVIGTEHAMYGKRPFNAMHGVKNEKADAKKLMEKVAVIHNKFLMLSVFYDALLFRFHIMNGYLYIRCEFACVSRLL